LEALAMWATKADCGAVVTFSGVLRGHSSTLDTLRTLECETSTEHAGRRVPEFAAEARHRWPATAAVAIHHRVGRVGLAQPTVLVAVPSPRRDEALEEAHSCFDTSKVIVSMLKRGNGDGGSAWSKDTSPVTNIFARGPWHLVNVNAVG
jgi:molybdopterin synthase catalytic subunit